MIDYFNSKNNDKILYVAGKVPNKVYQLRVTITHNTIFKKPIPINFDSNMVFLDVEIAKNYIPNFLDFLIKNKLINPKKGYEISIISLNVDNRIFGDRNTVNFDNK